jgi:hypothetical protein
MKPLKTGKRSSKRKIIECCSAAAVNDPAHFLIVAQWEGS